MSYLLENRNYEELECYFKDLTDSFSFQDNLYFSGNLIIDSIINHDLHNLCKEHVQKNVSGFLTDIETVSSIDLCTIFSNLLSNAIRAVNQCSEKENPQLCIQFDYGSEFFSITIVNSVSGSHPGSHKNSKQITQNRNHGYGLHKIKSICEKYDGIFNQTVENQKIFTTVYLPL